VKNHQPLIVDSFFYSVSGLKILSGAYLEVYPGTITALIGRNGSGKSTLLKIAAGQMKALSGITKLNGERIYSRSLKRRFRSISYLPQQSMLPGDMNVSRVFNSFISNGPASEDSFFKSMMNQTVKELSGGERRFLEILLIISLDRDFILLDEPFSGVEPRIIERIMERINNETQKGKGILLTDHLHRYVLEAADDAYLLQNRQCYKLGSDFAEELCQMGYLRKI
jgi:lipopolysaccharide export system ATP-binding protein